ncbi:Tripeptidyl aminopeptidase precursor [Nonomuraea coxensis DSM 45129]|uniref:Tripeptidyl aminopeptidase n=1 Tax=Nonomuraea coxensis DSM 45129 TaxID=1122611 RepID=A0ABX8U499_9ACTN|nr:alpha/beta fold hydrolase [Nonomuraea coxensis]QYC41716.1 Tripeptidyl aminopeptidase precursor [Nonomuraea coxensis DSM 45129]
MTDVIASEWLKLRSLRSNLHLLACSVAAVLACAGVAFMIGRGFDHQSPDERMAFAGNGDGLGNGIAVAYFVFATLGALAITSEYSTGMIRTSLVAMPRRHVLLLAKIPALAVVTLVAGQVLAFAMHAAAMAVLGDRAGQVLRDGRTLGTPLPEPGVLASVSAAGLSMAALALIGLGVGAAVRSTPGALVVLTVIIVVLPVAARTLPSPLRARAGSFMIENLPLQIAGVGGGLLPPAGAAGLLAAYVIAALTAGATAIASKGGRIKALAAGVAATVLVAAVPAAASASPRSGPSPLDWTACADKEMRCASIEVPVDWSKPSGRKIRLTAGMLPHTGAERRIGAVFAVPGGPGGSGVKDLSTYAGSFSDLRGRFDIVTVEPRNTVDKGVLPYECLISGPWIALPGSPAEYAEQGRRNREAAQRCRAADPEYFDHLDSASVARDMEAIRVALGEERLSFIGSSYGGIPAITYARLFPARVRAVVLDGTASPAMDRAESRLGSERAFARFAAWCAATTACALHGQDVGQVWRALIERADRSPIPVRAEPPVAYSGFDLKEAAAPSIIAPGRKPEHPRWAQLAEAIERAVGGDASGFAGYVRQGTYSLKVPSPVGMNMTHCPDGMGYGSYEEYREQRRKAERLLPNLSGIESWHPLGCVGWPSPVTNPFEPLPAQGLPPFLGVGSRTDFDGAADIVRRVPGSAALLHDGDGHALYNSGVTCVVGHVNRYLTSLRLPPPGTVCRPVE